MENEHSYWLRRLKEALKKLATDEITITLPEQETTGPKIALLTLDTEEDRKKEISRIEGFSAEGIKGIYEQVIWRLLREKMKRVISCENGVYKVTVDGNTIKEDHESPLFDKVIRKITDLGRRAPEIEDAERLS